MNGVIGYFGPPSLSKNVNVNPFASLVPTNIVLTSSEVAEALQDFNLPAWNTLKPNQKKMVAAYILENRETPEAQAQASKVLSGNPAFQVFQISYGVTTL
jgi:hypothetical protein